MSIEVEWVPDERSYKEWLEWFYGELNKKEDDLQ
jgi:hypothetical protein